MNDFFADIQAYVGFTAADAQVLRGLEGALAPAFADISEHFYQRILAHPKAHAAITGGAEQVARLKRTLVEWMRSGLLGPHDQAFYERRARIGRVHVQIGLPQQYMVTAVSVMRDDYRKVLQRELPDLARFAAAYGAVDRLFDLELAIMLETYRIDNEERLRRRERLATIGQLAASIGHDLRNPLGVIQSSLFILRRRVADDERSMRHIEKIERQVDVCDRIVTDLLDMARNNPPKRTAIAPAQLFDDALGQLQIPDEIEVVRSVQDGLVLHADPGLLRQALVNLIGNSLRALEPTPAGPQPGDSTSNPQAGRIELTAHARADGTVELRVIDDGSGFDPTVLPRAFEPLISTRPKGIGLGLSLVKSIAERHGGTASARNLEPRGAMVELLLPATPADAEPSSEHE